MGTVEIIKGDIVYTAESDRFTCVENGHVVVEEGKVVGVYEELPEKFCENPITDFSGKLIIPSFVDIHVHASQLENMGAGLDKELLPWLEAYTFPEEAKFKDKEYAKQVYGRFADGLIAHGTTRAVVFATIHTEATEVLMEILENRGIGAYVGRVNMDRNAVDYLTENTKTSISETEGWIKRHLDNDKNVKPIITPRFTITCTQELMKGLGELANKYGVPVQSHISENKDEIAYVRELEPEHSNYADTYNVYGLFGDTKTVMAHCVYCTAEEEKLMLEKNVFVAHCPASNLNICSGVAPIRRYMEKGILVGLGTDVSGGHSLSMLKTIVCAIHSSKVYRVYEDAAAEPLSVAEAFYLATKSGGKFFGNVGSFEQGYDFDCLVIDDTQLRGINNRSVAERIERFIYSGESSDIIRRYAFGKQIG